LFYDAKIPEAADYEYISDSTNTMDEEKLLISKVQFLCNLGATGLALSCKSTGPSLQIMGKVKNAR